MRWRQTELALLRALRAEGRTREEIAQALGRSVAAVRDAIACHDLPKRPRAWSDEDVAIMVEMVDRGETFGRIATRLDRSTEAVRRAYNKRRAPTSSSPAPSQRRRVNLAGVSVETAIWALRNKRSDPEAAVIAAALIVSNRRAAA